MSCVLSNRHFTKVLLGAAAASLAAISLPAQGRVWIVDAANGPGTNFTNLPPAIAAAADGDHIWVRAGSYSAASTGKALTILGINGTWFSPSFEVSGLPAGRDFVLNGFRGIAPFGTDATNVRVRNCAGRVLLDRIQAQPAQGAFSYASPAIEVVSSSLVTLQQSTVTGYPALAASASTVHVTDSDLTGGNAVLLFTPWSSRPAVNVTGGKLEVTNSTLRGGNGLVMGTPAAPSPALIADGGAMRIAGDAASCRLFAGTVTTLPAPALRGTLGNLRIDPNVVLVPYLTTSIAGTVNVQTLRLPALRALGAPPGGLIHVDLFASVGHIAALFVGQPADVVPLPVFGGDLGLDPLRMLGIATGPVGGDSRFTLDVSIPNNPALRGTNWVWQSLSGTPTDGFLISNRANYTNN